MAKISPLVILPPAIFAGLAGLFFAGMMRENPDELPSTFIGQPAPDLPDVGLSGTDILTAASLRGGEVTVVNFWASWCGPCRQEMPLLDRLHHRYEDTGFAVLGVNVEGEIEPAQEIVDKTNVTFPILIDDGQKVSDMYNLQAMPTTVVVDRDGVVRYVHPGYKPGDEAKYVEVVKKLIRE